MEFWQGLIQLRFRDLLFIQDILVRAVRECTSEDPRAYLDTLAHNGQLSEPRWPKHSNAGDVM